MVRLQKLVIKYQLVLFFLLVYPLSWWSIKLARGLFPHGVMLAAIIVILLSTGKPGLRKFWKGFVNFRASWLLFLATPALLIVFRLFDAGSSIFSGAKFAGFSDISFVAVAVELLLLGGLWEEPGWSGYALPALQKRFSKTKHGILIATLILGIFRGIWHLPLVVAGAIPWYDAVWFTPFIFQPFISWLYNRSEGSIPLVMFFHYLSNLFFPISPKFAGANEPLYTILYMSFGGLATFFLLWKTKFKLGWKEGF